MIAMLGDSFDSVKVTFTKLAGGDAALGSSDAARERVLLWVLVTWTACLKLHEVQSVQRAKMEAEPHVIPSLPQDDVADFRSRFTAAHPDVVLLPSREPHQKFIERVHRDFTINSIVPCYEVGEMRRRNEIVAQKAGLAPSADLLIKLVQQDELRVPVVSEPEVFERLHSFFVALEYLNICSFNDADGLLLYYRELQVFNQEAPGLQTLLKADRLVRREVHRLNTDERQSYPTFQEALLFVLKNCRWLWDKARIEAALTGSSSTAVAEVPARKRPADDSHDVSSSKVSKSKRRRTRVQEKLKSLGSSPAVPAPPAPAVNSKGRSKGTKSKGDRPKFPQALWAKVSSFKSNKCKFFNCGNCSAASSCAPELHACCECGGSHSYVSEHWH